MKSSEESAQHQSRVQSVDFQPSPAVLKDPRWTLALRVAGSESLRGSTRLRDFLLYVSECAIRRAPEDATEQQIGVNVFQRTPGYNSSEDSIVRSHARILRQKLADYFQTEGVSETTIIEMPKGHYLPTFHPREMGVKSGKSNEAASFPTVPGPVMTAAVTRKPFPYQPAIVLSLLLLATLAISVYLISKTSSKVPVATRSSLDTLWAPFMTGNPPLVIYSNALFLGDSKTGLRYPPADVKPEQIDPEHSVSNYTGIGELAGVYQLTKLFDARQSSFILKRSLLVTWDEARLTNLIFIGSTAENPTLRVLPTSDFTMMSGPDYAGFINHHPKPGEPELFSRPEHPVTKDYAIIAYLPGVERGRQVLMFSGLTTLGTQAAVEFACQPESVSELLKSGGFPNGQLRHFEALIEVTISGGVPLQTRLVTVRVH